MKYIAVTNVGKLLFFFFLNYCTFSFMQLQVNNTPGFCHRMSFSAENDISSDSYFKWRQFQSLLMSTGLGQTEYKAVFDSSISLSDFCIILVFAFLMLCSLFVPDPPVHVYVTPSTFLHPFPLC